MSKQHLTEEELIEKYDAVLDLREISLSVVDQVLRARGSVVVKRVDPIMYRTGLAQFADWLEKDQGITAEGYVS